MMIMIINDDDEGDDGADYGDAEYGDNHGEITVM